MSSRADVARLIKLSPVRVRSRQSGASDVASLSTPVVAVFAEDARLVADLRLPPLKAARAERHVDVVILPSIADTHALTRLARSLAHRAVVIFASSDLRAAHARTLGATFAEHVAAIGIVATTHTAPNIATLIAEDLAAAQARALPPSASDQPRAIAPTTTAIDRTTAQAIVADARALLARYLTETPALIDTLIFWSLAAWGQRFDIAPRLILHARDPRADHARALRLLRYRIIGGVCHFRVADISSARTQAGFRQSKSPKQRAYRSAKSNSVGNVRAVGSDPSTFASRCATASSSETRRANI